jgi:serine/threonine-protein kinase
VSSARASYVEQTKSAPKHRIRQSRGVPVEPDHRISTEADSNRYQILERLGEGGTGVVWHARDLLLEMDVAVKILHPTLAADADAIAAMKQEAIVAMQLGHTCIVRLFNFARVGSNYFLVMELVKGRTFQSLLREAGSFTPHAVNEIVHVCADALDYAHRHGVLHNDLKPANILLNSEGVIKIIDFGIACLVDHQRNSGEIAGTPQYMSPEQLRGDMLGPQTDIYAFGIIAFQLLTGRLPYPHDCAFDDLAKVARLPLDGLPPGMTAVLETATAPDPMARYASIADFARAFAHAYHADFGPGGPSSSAPIVAS